MDIGENVMGPYTARSRKVNYFMGKISTIHSKSHIYITDNYSQNAEFSN